MVFSVCLEKGRAGRWREESMGSPAVPSQDSEVPWEFLSPGCGNLLQHVLSMTLSLTGDGQLINSIVGNLPIL